MLSADMSVMVDRASMVSALREESLFITNVLKFLPPELNSGYGGDSDDSEEAAGDHRAPFEESDERHDELRAKLQAKLSSLKEKNGSMSTQKRLRQRLSRLERRGDGGVSSTDKRTGQKRAGGGAKQNNARANAVKCDKKQKMIARRSGKVLTDANNKNKNKRTIYNADGKLVFSKFDFAHEASAVTAERESSSREGLSARLARARRLQQKQDGADGGQGEDEQQQQRRKWSAALQKADGQKLRDDPQLLARTLRRKRQNRARSQREWQSRVERQSREQRDKQQKRAANIQQRKQAKQSRRVQSLKKKGRIIPGF